MANHESGMNAEARRKFEELIQEAHWNGLYPGKPKIYGPGIGAGVVGAQPAAPVAPTDREIAQDLLARAARNAVRNTVMPFTSPMIGEHRKLVERMLEEFTEAASYLQAQIPMVEAAFKDRPELLHRMVMCLQEAYHKLCYETFGKGDH